MNKYQSYKQSGVEWIGEIPEHWIVSKLKWITLEHRQGYYSSNDYDDTGYRMVRITDINDDNSISVENSPFYDIENTDYLRFGLSKGDFLFPRTGGVGRFGIFSSNIQSIYGSFLIRFRFTNEVGHSFIKFYLNSSIFLTEIEKEIHGGVNKNVHVENIKDCIIVYPKSLTEQLQIVQFLEKKTYLIDKLIKCIEQRKELLKEKRLGLIQKIVLNNKIERIRLKYVVDLINRPITESDSSNYTRIGMYNWGRGIFKYEEEIGSELGDSEFSIIKEGDLILSGQFSWEGSVSIVESEFDNCICSHRFHILKGKNNVLLNEYLWGYFTSQEGHSILDNNSNGFAGRNRPLNIGKLLKEKIPIPNLNIQNEIKNIVEIERKNNEYSQKMKSLLKEYRQSLISEVVTGKIKVTTDE